MKSSSMWWTLGFLFRSSCRSVWHHHRAQRLWNQRRQLSEFHFLKRQQQKIHNCMQIKQTDFNKLSMRVYMCIHVYVCLLGCWRIHYRRVVWGTAKSNSTCQNLPFKKCMLNIFFKFYSFKHHSSPLKQKTMQISLKQETQLHVHVLYIIVSS